VLKAHVNEALALLRRRHHWIERPKPCQTVCRRLLLVLLLFLQQNKPDYQHRDV